MQYEINILVNLKLINFNYLIFFGMEFYFLNKKMILQHFCLELKLHFTNISIYFIESPLFIQLYLFQDLDIIVSKFKF